MWVYWQSYLPKLEDIQLLKEAQIDVISEKYRPETADAVLRNKRHPVSERSNSLKSSENDAFRVELIRDSID